MIIPDPYEKKPFPSQSTLTTTRSMRKKRVSIAMFMGKEFDSDPPGLTAIGPG
jgi:hypothetical protein